jgi:AraC-like DNA-binding protein
MSVLIRVDDEPPRSRPDYFRHVVADTFVPFDVRTDPDRELRARLVTEQVGAVQVTKVSAPPLKAFRTRRHIRASDPELFKLEAPASGPTVFAQSDREAVLNAGDLTLLDLSRPCLLADRGREHANVAVMFPHAALPLRHDELSRLTAVRISGQDGLGAPISSLTRHISQHLVDHDSEEGARLGTALIDLLVVALAERLDRVRTVAPATRRRALVASVQTYVERRLPDPLLSPASIAAAHHISLRYLYKLFETEHTSVAGWIRERRLERCRRDLLDPALADRPVSTIAARWGLLDPAYFSRAFRAAYGLPPSEYRSSGGVRELQPETPVSVPRS